MDEKKQPEKVERVTSGNVSIDNRLTVNKLARTFFKEDLDTVVKNAITDQLLPRLIDTVYYTLTNGLAEMCYGKDGRSHVASPVRSGSGTTKISYHKVYQNNETSHPKTVNARPGMDLDPQSVRFETRMDAQNTVDKLYDILEEYHCVSIATFFEAAGVQNDNYTYENYGWEDLKGLEIKRNGDGSYYIKFPRAGRL